MRPRALLHAPGCCSAEELGRPENAGLKALVEKLKAAKAKIDAGDVNGAGPISWADTIYLAGRVATQASWAQIKVGARWGGDVQLSGGCSSVRRNHLTTPPPPQSCAD